MCRGICLSVLLVNLIVSSTQALSIRLSGATSSAPFDITYQEVDFPLDIAFQVANDSDMTASVLGWQLDLELRALDGAQGAVLFYDAAAPPEPLFDQTSEPQCNPDLPPPSDRVFIQDVNTSGFEGEPVPPQSARNIVRLTLSTNPNTAGAFQLVVPYVDDPESDSSWFDGDEFSPKPFDNSTPSAFPGFVLLGTINVGQTYPPGDYNRDDMVTAADYDLWRAGFGSIVAPGEMADGNRNGTVDAADYVLWRRNVTTSSGEEGNSSIEYVPEPGSLVLASLASIMGGLFQRSARSSPSPKPTREK